MIKGKHFGDGKIKMKTAAVSDSVMFYNTKATRQLPWRFRVALS